MVAIGKALRYQYEAGAAMDTDFPGPTFCFRLVRKARYPIPSSDWPMGLPFTKMSVA
jgi:hypothetical protein